MIKDTLSLLRFKTLKAWIEEIIPLKKQLMQSNNSIISLKIRTITLSLKIASLAPLIIMTRRSKRNPFILSIK